MSSSGLVARRADATRDDAAAIADVLFRYREHVARYWAGYAVASSSLVGGLGAATTDTDSARGSAANNMDAASSRASCDALPSSTTAAAARAVFEKTFREEQRAAGVVPPSLGTVRSGVERMLSACPGGAAEGELGYGLLYVVTAPPGAPPAVTTNREEIIDRTTSPTSAAEGEEGSLAVVGVGAVTLEVSDWRGGFVWYLHTFAVDPCRYAVSLPPPTVETTTTNANTRGKEGAPAPAATTIGGILGLPCGSAVTKALVAQLQADIAADERAAGLRIYVEDDAILASSGYRDTFQPRAVMPVATACSAQNDSSHQVLGTADATSHSGSHSVSDATAAGGAVVMALAHRSDSSAFHKGLFSHTDASPTTAGFEVEHYRMMTWYK